MKDSILKSMAQSAVIPVVVIEDADNAVKTAEALIKGGINVMEITMRTEAALESIRNVAAECRDMNVGAGTVVTLEQCEKAVAAGARFIVSPGFSPEITDWCISREIPVIPGCVTPTEIMEAMAHGVSIVKMFPADIYGGVKAVRKLGEPFFSVKFVPTGGVSESNLAEYLSEDKVFAVGGSWLCKKTDISEGNFDIITKLCINARQIAEGVR